MIHPGSPSELVSFLVNGNSLSTIVDSVRNETKRLRLAELSVSGQVTASGEPFPPLVAARKDVNDFDRIKGDLGEELARAWYLRRPATDQSLHVLRLDRPHLPTWAEEALAPPPPPPPGTTAVAAAKYPWFRLVRPKGDGKAVLFDIVVVDRRDSTIAALISVKWDTGYAVRYRTPRLAPPARCRSLALPSRQAWRSQLTDTYSEMEKDVQENFRKIPMYFFRVADAGTESQGRLQTCRCSPLSSDPRTTINWVEEVAAIDGRHGPLAQTLQHLERDDDDAEGTAPPPPSADLLRAVQIDCLETFGRYLLSSEDGEMTAMDVVAPCGGC